MSWLAQLRRKVVKLLILSPIFASVAVLIVCLARTIAVRPQQEETVCRRSEWEFIDRTEALKRFLQSLDLETVSWSPNVTNYAEILKFHQLLKDGFPTVHKSPLVDVHVINNYSLLYYVKGSDTTLKPFLLSAHLDVVPAERDKWSFHPFQSSIHEGYIYARGTIDDKQNVMGIMEALEFLLSTNYRPKRPFYLAFGHDEEVNGYGGAREITKKLKKEKVQLEFVLDEGLVVMDRVFPGILEPLALIGVTEKGYLTLEMKVDGETGHSSMPPSETAIGILAQALARLEANPHPTMFGKGPEINMFQTIAPYAHVLYRFVYANLWLLKPVLAWVMSMKPAQNALVRTTTAITMIRGGIKENVVPTNVSAIVNHRIHPAQTVEDVINYDKRVIHDERVKIEVKSSTEPHPVSKYDDSSVGYNSIYRSIKQVFLNAIVAPGVLTGNTDSRWYIQLTPNVYRFSPSFLAAEDIPRFHGNDERISIENYFQVINFYHHLIKNVDSFKSKISDSHSFSEL